MNSEKLKKYKSLNQEIDKYPQIKELLRGNDSIDQLFELSLSVDPERKALYKSLYDGVGDTNCYTLHLPNNNLLHVKLECSNPMGNSHYSRYWIPHLYLAEAMGIIEPNQSHILEVSSGSSGIALAIACNKLGYELSIIVPSEIPPSRVLPMKSQGANVIQEENYISGCIRKLRKMISSGNYYCPNHSEEKIDLITHIFRRIIIEHHKKHWFPDYAVLGIGNGTTTQAIFEYLKRWDRRCKCHSYHPVPDGNHLIFGLYAQEVDLRHVKESVNLSDEIYTFEEIDIQKIREEFTNDTEISNLGDSSLIGLYYALLVSEKVKEKNFFTLGYDKNDRY